MRYLVSDPHGGEAWMNTRTAEIAAEAYAICLARDGELHDDETVRLTVTDPDGGQTTWDAACEMQPDISVVEVESDSESDA